jgi:excisionase family DNA binding protein
MRLMTAKEVAEILRVTPARVYQMGRKGILPIIRFGRQVRFDEALLVSWIKQGGSRQFTNQEDRIRDEPGDSRLGTIGKPKS